MDSLLTTPDVFTLSSLSPSLVDSLLTILFAVTYALPGYLISVTRAVEADFTVDAGSMQSTVTLQQLQTVP